MKQVMYQDYPVVQNQPSRLLAAVEDRKPLTTRFGDEVDVRNRGTLRMSRFAGTQALTQDAPAVVRLWNDEQCHELSAHKARALAAQLLAAAALADTQNSH
jgi:hypothetical protein